MYFYLEFKLRYLKNLKLFSIRVKESVEPIVLWIRGNGFVFSLKAFLWETDLWATLGMLGDITVKKCKIGKGNLYLTENRLSRNEMWCAAENQNHTCHIYAKGILDLNFSSNFYEIAPNFTYSQKSYFLKYYWKILGQQLLPDKFHGRNM